MTAIIVVLQVVASFVKFGPFSITLALAPIIIGAALYGAGAGAWLGAVFGVVVLIACIAGWDYGGNVLFTANPLLTAALCIVKGAVSSARWSTPAFSSWACPCSSTTSWWPGPVVLT